MLFKTLTNKEFDKKLFNINPNLTRIDDYKGNIITITFKCELCSYTWKIKPAHINSCPNCKKMYNRKIRQANFDINLKKIRKDVKRLEKYISNHTKIKFKCKICKHIWKVQPSNILKGSGCPNCYNKIRSKISISNNKELDIKILSKNLNILRIGNYIKALKKIEFKCLECNNIFLSRPNDILSGYGCPKCNKLINIQKRTYTNKDFDKKLKKINSDIIRIENYKKSNIKIEFKCLLCNYKWKTRPGNLLNCKSGCPNCNKSLLEKEIQTWLKSYIKIEENKRFFENKKFKYELDIFIPSKNIGIEINGEYYHSEISGNKNKKYHLDKTNYFKNKNIFVIHIWGNEWDNKKEIVKSLILNKLGILKNKIYARKCNIKKITPKEAKKFLNENHLQGFISSKIYIGLFYKETLLQVSSFSKTRYNKKYDYELVRFATKINILVTGGFSKILYYFKKNYIGSIISYADKRYSTGKVYIKNKFKFLHETSPNYYYTKNHYILESRIKYQKHKLKNILENFNPKLSEWENMKNNGYDRIWDCGNLVFVIE